MTDRPYGQHLDPLWDRLAENNERMKAVLDFAELAANSPKHGPEISNARNLLLDFLVRENISIMNELANSPTEL